MRHVIMDFPLDMHKNAFKASEAALCAGDQGKYWEMSNKLFNNPTNNPTWLEKENVLKLAEESGVDMGVFKACLDSGKHIDEIRKRIAEGQTKAGISGTPGFLLGFIRADGTVKATKKIVGAVPFINFKTAIDEMLGSKKKE
jgi:protein-disulfide isomerase